MMVYIHPQNQSNDFKSDREKPMHCDKAKHVEVYTFTSYLLSWHRTFKLHGVAKDFMDIAVTNLYRLEQINAAE